MKKNIGITDRIARALIGLLLLAYAWWQASWLALFFSLFCLIEAGASWCIYYQLIGKNSCPLNKNKKNGTEE